MAIALYVTGAISTLKCTHETKGSPVAPDKQRALLKSHATSACVHTEVSLGCLEPGGCITNYWVVMELFLQVEDHFGKLLSSLSTSVHRTGEGDHPCTPACLTQP